MTLPLAALLLAATLRAQPNDSRAAAVLPLPTLEVVYFETDRWTLSPEAAAVLTANASWLKDHPTLKVQVTGHADQRGTRAYNLSIGKLRANAVRKHYRKLGVDSARIVVVSYGEDRPTCAEKSEGCWHANRRVESLLAFPQATP